MEALINLRNQIDELDDKIIKLIDERMNVCKNVGKVKKDNNIGLTHSNRENEIINRLSIKSNLNKDEIESIYKNIFNVSKSKQI